MAGFNLITEAESKLARIAVEPHLRTVELTHGYR
jgi:hypothetical protein